MYVQTRKGTENVLFVVCLISTTFKTLALQAFCFIPGSEKSRQKMIDGTCSFEGKK